MSQKASSSIVAGEQKKAEKGLHDNRLFIYYMDSSIVNCADDQMKGIFSDAVKHDLVAQFYYLRFSFTDSFREIRTSQEKLIDLYQAMIDQETVKTKRFLNNNASRVINSKDQKSSAYLRLAYRNLSVCEIEKRMADHYRKSLFSLRLHKYVRAMISLKESKRYGVIAVLQAANKTELMKLKDVYTFDYLKTIIEESERIEDKDTVLLMHYDSYYRFINGESAHAAIWEDPQLDDYQPYIDYINKTE